MYKKNYAESTLWPHVKLNSLECNVEFKMCNCTCPMKKMLKNILTFISGQGWFGVIGYRGSGQIHVDCINRSVHVNWVNHWSSYCDCCSHCRRCRRRIISTLLSFWPNLHLRLYESLHNNNSLACFFSLVSRRICDIFFNDFVQFSNKREHFDFLFSSSKQFDCDE